MGKLEILLPAMGEGIHDALLTKWLVKEGDTIAEDDSIAEVATDKVDSEIPAPVDGIVKKLLYTEGEQVAVGQVIAILQTDGDDEPEQEQIIETAKVDVEHQTKTIQEKNETVKLAEKKSQTETGKFLSPLVRKIVSTENISDAELNTLNGTGLNGRITKDDLLAYLQTRNTQTISEAPKTISTPAQSAKTVNTPTIASQKSSASAGNVEVIEMDRTRKLIAEHMVNSKHTSPHVTSFHLVDMTKVVNWRNKVKKSYNKKYGENITFMPIVAEATAQALKDYPLVNASIDGTNIVVKKDINLGFATALPNGNLIVPVVKKAGLMNLNGLTQTMNDLAIRARNNKLQPDEIQGGTFTISNLGSFGNLTGTPIINQPQVAILAVGIIRKVPAVIETPYGDTIGIKQEMVLSLSYDHRLVDGALGGMLLKRIADFLENWNENREI